MHLLSLDSTVECHKISVYVVENDSNDDTRAILLRLAEHSDKVIPLFLDNIDARFPLREARIAFCRDRLLSEITKSWTDGLYVPIDLDADIATSLDSASFMDACQLVLRGMASGIFPISYPYYYDIHALRERQWCQGSCLKEMNDSRARGSLGHLLVYIRYVSTRQKSYTALHAKGLIPIQSAFGGVGIYSLRQVLLSGARYSSPELEQVDLKLCEHVVFNSFLDQLFISSAWVVTAPPEHIDFCLLPAHRKIWKIFCAAVSDLKRLPLAISRSFQSNTP